jgi:hypothetical protein
MKKNHRDSANSISEGVYAQSIQSARLSVQSSELGSPTPSSASGGCTPPPPGDTLDWGEGVVGPNSDEGTDTLVLYVYYNPSTNICIQYSVFREPVFLNVYGAPELIPRNEFRQPM